MVTSWKPSLASALLLAGLAGCAADQAGSGDREHSGLESDTDGAVLGKTRAAADGNKAGVSGTSQGLTKSFNDRYIVHFNEHTVAHHYNLLREQHVRLNIPNGVGRRMSLGHPDVAAYHVQAVQKQGEHLSHIARMLGRDAVERRFTSALNAAVMTMSLDEAKALAQLDGVALVEPDTIQTLVTDRGPIVIGAPGIWDGSQSGLASQGEGQVVGIIDTGVAFNVPVDGVVGPHPSFATTGGDGYVHTSPLGAGKYLGGCVQHPEWCTEKLIGIYSFLDGSGGPGTFAPSSDEIYKYKDIGGHGTHVASTAAGNVLLNVPMPDAEGTLNKNVVFPRISGVAPHAAIIMYKVFKVDVPIPPATTFTTTSANSDIMAAVEQAINDGIVDSINHSISSAAVSPWAGGQGLAFLAAREAGIFVASAAGNDGDKGPGQATRNGSGPWNAVVAATTHDRSFPPKQLHDLTGGDTTPPAAITGRSASGGITGRIVYGGNYKVGVAGNPGFDQANLCMGPYPKGTFEPDMIVLCDRGVNGRTQKGQMVRDGGAGGIILANVTGGATSVDDDAHVIPSINIDAASGAALRTWLATGTGHVGTIDAAGPPVSNPALQDLMASFSSTGPFIGFDLLGPNVAAPGVAILAAGTGYPGAPDVTGMFGFLQGTSMATPHITGAAALIKGVRPTWTDAEVLSAMMTTGYTGVKKATGAAADPYDFGGGRAQLGQAVKAGLLLDETVANFRAANPALGGDVSKLNLAQLVRWKCVAECSFTRTFKATTAGTWKVGGTAFLTATPAEFTLKAGQTQVVTIKADARSFPVGKAAFGQLTLTPSSADLPVQHLSAAITPAVSDIPSNASFVMTRTQGSNTLANLHSVAIDSLSTVVTGLGIAATEEHTAAQDVTPNAPFDDLTVGTTTTLVPYPADTSLFVVDITDTDAVDLDMRVGYDANNDGLPSAAETVCTSATDSALEHCVLDLSKAPAAHPPIWIAVQNYAASAADATDPYTLALTKVGTTAAGNLTVSGPTGPVAAGVPWNLQFNWTSPPKPGDLAYGRVLVYSKAEQVPANLLGQVDVQFKRGANDLTISAPADVVKAGTPFSVSLQVSANADQQARKYHISVPLPAGINYVNGSGGTLSAGAVTFDVTQPAGATTPITVAFQATSQKSNGGKTVTFTATHTVDNPNSIAESVSADIKVSKLGFSGFLFPTPPSSKVFIGWPTVLHFFVRDIATGRTVRDAKVTLSATNAAGEVVLPPTDAGNTVLGEFFYLLDTSSWKAGVYTVTATLDDGTAYSMNITVRAFSLGALFGF
jgi:subtilisin family serine protease